MEVGVLILLLLFAIKHFLCDFPFQSLDMVKNKGTYGHPDGVMHATIHAVGTALVFLSFLGVLSGSFNLVLVLLCSVLGALDGVLHYHIDYLKVKHFGHLTPDDPEFWHAFGADQALHYITYLILIASII